MGPMPPAAYAMPPRPPRRPGGGSLVPRLGIVLGAFITLGLLMFHIAYLLPVPCTNPPYCPTTTPELQNYANVLQVLLWVAFTAMDVAVGLSVIVAFTVAGPENNLAESTKRGIFLFATVFTAVWIFFGTYLVLSILASVRYYL